MKKPALPQQITKQGITATIRRVLKRGYESFRVEYAVQGKRKQVWRSDYQEARRLADNVIESIANGDHGVLELRDTDRLAYQRATEILKPAAVTLDVAARDYVEAVRILDGQASVIEACRYWVKLHTTAVTKSTVPDAVNELIRQITTEQRNTTGGARRKDAWVKLLSAHLRGKLAKDFNCNVSELSSTLLEPWLVGLKGSERTRANIRDCVAFFIKWAKGRNYLAKDADPLANVLKFRKRKRGAVMTITAEELATLLQHSPADFIPYLALRAFAGLRDNEARLLDWKHIDLSEKWIDIPEHIAKQANKDEGVARMVRIRPTLAAWLRPRLKSAGPVCPYKNTVKALAKLKSVAGLTVPRNALRHSFISAAMTLSNDLNAVSVEAGNSPSIIRAHYWRRMRPQQARAWFNVLPPAGEAGPKKPADSKAT